MSNESDLPWYKQHGWIIALLVLLAPVGIALTWKYSRWTQNTKVAATLASVLFFVFVQVDAHLDDSRPSRSNAPEIAPASPPHEGIRTNLGESQNKSQSRSKAAEIAPALPPYEVIRTNLGESQNKSQIEVDVLVERSVDRTQMAALLPELFRRFSQPNVALKLRDRPNAVYVDVYIERSAVGDGQPGSVVASVAMNAADREPLFHSGLIEGGLARQLERLAGPGAVSVDEATATASITSRCGERFKQFCSDPVFVAGLVRNVVAGAFPRAPGLRILRLDVIRGDETIVSLEADLAVHRRVLALQREEIREEVRLNETAGDDEVPLEAMRLALARRLLTKGVLGPKTRIARELSKR